MTKRVDIYLDTPIERLLEMGVIDKTVAKACRSSHPPMDTAGDIVRHLQEQGSFSDVPGCRRPGRITETLTEITRIVRHENMPSELKPTVARRIQAGQRVEDAGFSFLSESERKEVLDFRERHGYLPMIRIFSIYVNSPLASRDDRIMASSLGLNSDKLRHASLAGISSDIGLSRERVRQVIRNYQLPEELSHAKLWKNYADHSTYYSDESSETFRTASAEEIPELPFSTYAEIISRISMLENIENKFLARKGWTDEISAWVNKLQRLAALPRKIENRISIDGLAMGGSLDTRLSVVVINQIAPALGIRGEAPDALIFLPNVSD